MAVKSGAAPWRSISILGSAIGCAISIPIQPPVSGFRRPSAASIQTSCASSWTEGSSSSNTRRADTRHGQGDREGAGRQDMAERSGGRRLFAFVYVQDGERNRRSSSTRRWLDPRCCRDAAACPCCVDLAVAGAGLAARAVDLFHDDAGLCQAEAGAAAFLRGSVRRASRRGSAHRRIPRRRRDGRRRLGDRRRERRCTGRTPPRGSRISA